MTIENKEQNQLILRQMNQLSSLTDNIIKTESYQENKIVTDDFWKVTYKAICCLCNKEFFGKVIDKGWFFEDIHYRYKYFENHLDKVICPSCYEKGTIEEMVTTHPIERTYSFQKSFSLERWKESSSLFFLQEQKENLISIQNGVNDLTEENEALFNKNKDLSTNLAKGKDLLQNTEKKLTEAERQLSTIEDKKDQENLNLRKELNKDKQDALNSLASNIEIRGNWHDRELIRKNVELENAKTILRDHIQANLSLIKNQANKLQAMETNFQQKIERELAAKDLEIKILSDDLKSAREMGEIHKSSYQEQVKITQESYRLRLELQQKEETLKLQLQELEHQKKEELRIQRDSYENQIKELGVPIWFQRTSSFLGINSPTKIVAKGCYFLTLSLIIGFIFLSIRPIKWTYKQLKRLFKEDENSKD